MTNVQNALELIHTFASGDTYIQHNTGIADGVSGLGEALAALAKQGIAMVYTTTHQVLAQGSFVLAVSEGTFGGAHTSYYDLWRVENGKIAEHWDVMETIADESTWQNSNGKFSFPSGNQGTFSCVLYDWLTWRYDGQRGMPIPHHTVILEG